MKNPKRFLMGEMNMCKESPDFTKPIQSHILALEGKNRDNPSFIGHFLFPLLLLYVLVYNGITPEQ